MTNTVEFFINRGRKHYLSVDFDEAVDDFTQAILLDPNNVPARVHRAEVHYRLLRFDMAIADLEAALVLAPGDSDIERLLVFVKEDLRQRTLTEPPEKAKSHDSARS